MTTITKKALDDAEALRQAQEAAAELKKSDRGWDLNPFD